MHRVLVFGGRDFSRRDVLFDALDEIRQHNQIDSVITGSARGVDSFGSEWAVSRGIPLIEYPANWDKHGRRAGPIRNQQMLDEGKPTLGVQFPGGTGTEDMRRRLNGAGVRVIEVRLRFDAPDYFFA